MYFDEDKGEHGGYRRLKGDTVGLYVVVGNTTPIDVNVADGDITLNASDIQIGAVELKDGETENRLTIEVDGTKYALYVQSESLAQESTLAGVALESGGNLDTIAGKDFATQTTLETVATEVKTPDRTVDTIIDNATFNATVEGSAISMIGYRHLMITSVLGAKTDTPTYTVSLQVQDSNDNWITYDTLPTLSTGSETQVETYYDIPADTVRVVATLASTTSFADVTLEVTRMN
ncbi:MAG: hypothetical protein A4E25_00340 [Methanobacterium sp. PtaB.Bin024]|nr:MAG: hypothetical protein A4E25_00340 [Methanobacterium sp. PtaB.Bin024]